MIPLRIISAVRKVGGGAISPGTKIYTINVIFGLSREKVESGGRQIATLCRAQRSFARPCGSYAETFNNIDFSLFNFP